MVSIRCFRDVGELRRTKSIPFKVFTWNTGAVLGLVPWASSTPPNSSAPRESNKDNNSLLVIQVPGMFLAIRDRVASAARDGKDSLRDRTALLGSELLTSNSEFPGHRFGFVRDLPDRSRSGGTVRG